MRSDTSYNKLQYLPLFISILITQAVGIASAYFTLPEVEGWYRTLNRPVMTPPDWAFAPTWTILYLIMGISAYLVWLRRDGSAAYKVAAAVYISQLFLNFLWAFVFFGMHQLFGAVMEDILLLLAIITNIVCFQRFSRTAAWLLVPYLLWVGYALIDNFEFFMLNR